MKIGILTKKEAKELSIKKWEYIVEKKGAFPSNLTVMIPELKGLSYSCGYCEKYLNTYGKTLDQCEKCPLRPKIKDYDDLTNVGCCQAVHPFDKWYNIEETSPDALQYAKELLELIKKS